ncbi:hypothetical protein [Methylobacterium nigriterrae]|uniref:hypothetical protein n=1 Tax=Methylobacterium nigriterrae TaxID=3127512 RepID=UPI0030139717
MGIRLAWSGPHGQALLEHWLRKRAAGVSAPFILANSLVALVGVLAVGQRPAAGSAIYAGAALLGAVLGTAIGLRWLSQAATRYILALILLLAGGRLLLM